MSDPLFGFLNIQSVSDLAAAEREVENYLALASQAGNEPEVYVPFTLDKKAALDSFHKWLHSLTFVPGNLKKTADLGALKPVYVPFWAVHSMTYTSYTGERGEEQKTTEEYTDPAGETKTREATTLEWRPVRGEVRQHFEELYVCGVNDLPAGHVVALTPRQLTHHQVYSADGVAQTNVRRSDLDVRTAFTRARKLMEDQIKSLVQKDIGGKQQKISRMETRHVGVAIKHLLVPAFEGTYRYAGKEYKVVINGGTGEVAGDHPISAGKIILLILGILVAIAAVIGIVWFFVHK